MSKLPVCIWKELVNALEKWICSCKAKKGTYITTENTAERIYRTVVLLHKKLAKRTLLDILHQTGLSKEELISLL